MGKKDESKKQRTKCNVGWRRSLFVCSSIPRYSQSPFYIFIVIRSTIEAEWDPREESLKDEGDEQHRSKDHFQRIRFQFSPDEPRVYRDCLVCWHLFDRFTGVERFSLRCLRLHYFWWCGLKRRSLSSTSSLANASNVKVKFRSSGKPITRQNRQKPVWDTSLPSAPVTLLWWKMNVFLTGSKKSPPRKIPSFAKSPVWKPSSRQKTDDRFFPFL